MVELIVLKIAMPVLTLIFGVLILLFPKILNYLVGFYLVLAGILGILSIA